jgi:hypothetical protein
MFISIISYFFHAFYDGELPASMSAPLRTTLIKILQSQTRVSNAVGEFIEDGSRKRK